jgi:hypothetical protein
VIEDFEALPELPSIMGPAKQIAYVVDDIDAAMKQWHDTHGVGPFLINRNAVPINGAYYRGNKAQRTTVHIAFAYIGDMQLELIELIGDTPGLYKEARDRQHQGVHHYAVCVDDFPAAYNWALDNGFDAVIDAGVDGLARMSYVENRETGLILEIIEWNPLTRPIFDGLEKRVRSADSSQLLHEFNLTDLTPKLTVLVQLLKFSLKKLFGGVEQTRRPITSGVTA